MPWYNKEANTPFDPAPIEGLFFLISDLALPGRGMEGMKYPKIAFPSGEELELWDGKALLVHLFPGMDLPLFDLYETAWKHALAHADDGWFTVFGIVAKQQLELWSHQTEEVFFVTYDNNIGRMVDVQIAAA
jgi:hypothetical protein